MDISLQILLFTALLIGLAKAMASLSTRLGLPLVLGELVAGVLLGPTALNVWRLPWFSSPAAVAGHVTSVAAVFKVLAQLGAVVLMFLAGLETDRETMKSAVGPAFWVALGGVALPFVGGCFLSRLAGFGWGEAVFIGTILTATSVSITAQTLLNLDKLRSKTGSTILGAAVFDDVLGLMLLSFVIAAAPRAGHAQAFGWVGVGTALARLGLFVLLAFGLGPRLTRFILNQAQRLHRPHNAVAAALAIAFLFAFLAGALGGMAAITGAYLAGLFIAGTPARSEVVRELRSMTHSFFGPLFFVSVGLEVNAWHLGGHFRFFLLILLVAILGKVLGCGLGAWLNGSGGRNALIVGVGMIPRGEVGLITANIGWAAGLISSDIYSLVVVLVLATTLVTPAFLRLVFASHPPSLAPASPPVGEAAPDPPAA